ncbi:MAG: TRAP transporter substrate-binding protein DctP [Gammaproteobacteria bacterium]|nr:TRAP transporter substrate-binding protein DctP [Gammaproteobacteria bacterium]
MVLLALMACGAPQDDAVVELVYATPYSPNHPFSLADQQWMKFVHDRSGGTLRIKPNWSGALLSSEHSMVELRHGVADIGLITPIYVKGGAHLIRLQSGFYSGTTSFEQQVALYRCMAASSPQFAHELQGLKILAIQGGPLPGIVTTHKPLHSLDDIQGMRIRAPTELLNVLKRLGADPVNMPMGEVYSALAKGVLDGVIAPMDTFRSLHFAEVTHYYAGLIVPRGAYPARAMSEQRWSLLSPEHRAVLEEGIAVWEAALARQTEIALVAGEQAAEAAKIEFTALPAADQTRFDDLYLELARGNASSLSRYGIDGLAVFSVARASVQPDGTVSCRGGSH